MFIGHVLPAERQCPWAACSKCMQLLAVTRWVWWMRTTSFSNHEPVTVLLLLLSLLTLIAVSYASVTVTQWLSDRKFNVCAVIQFYCNTVPLSYMIDERKLLFYRKILLSKNVMLWTLMCLPGVSSDFMLLCSKYSFGLELCLLVLIARISSKWELTNEARVPNRNVIFSPRPCSAYCHTKIKRHINITNSNEEMFNHSDISEFPNF